MTTNHLTTIERSIIKITLKTLIEIQKEIEHCHY